MKKLIATLLCAAMVASLAACGSSSSSSETQAATEAAGSEAAETEASGASQYQTTYGSKQFDNVTITVELFDRSNAPEGSTITENRWTEYAQEQMAKVGINVEYVAVPRGDEVTKMNTMMSTGTAPTILGTYTWTYARDFYDQGGTWDLSEFVMGDDQAQNLKAYLGENCLSLGTNPDGSMYGIVARRSTVACNNIFIRKDWLDAAGLDIPTTPDELEEALKVFVDQNPDGEENVWGAVLGNIGNPTTATGTSDCMELAFSTIAGDEKAYAVAQGFEFYADGGYIDWLKWVNNLYHEGLISSEFVSQTDEQLQAHFVNNQLGFLEGNVGYNVDVLRGSLLQALKDNYPDAEFVAMPFLQNVNDGQVYCPAYSEGGMSLFCPKTATAEEVEAAITYLDWMATKDGGFVFYHGFEGEHFEYNEDGVPIAIDADYNQTDKDWIRTDLFLIGNQGYFATTEEFNQAIAADNPGWEDYTLDDYNYALDGVVLESAAYITAPELQTETANDFSLLKSQYLAQCVTCDPDQVETIYAEWCAQAEALGVEEILELRAEAYDQVKGTN